MRIESTGHLKQNTLQKNIGIRTILYTCTTSYEHDI